MKCEQIRAVMMDYLYDELSNKDCEAFITHLDQCDECRKEVESLKTTSGILQQWEDVEHDIRLIVVKEKTFSFDKFKEFLNNHLLKPKKLALGFAGAFSVVFLFLALANTEISMNNGNFNMRMGFFDRHEKQVNTGIANSSQLVEDLVRENFLLTRSLIEQSEARQQQELAFVLSSFKKGVDLQRYQDLKLIQYGLKDFQKNTYLQFREIDNTLNVLSRSADIKYYSN